MVYAFFEEDKWHKTDLYIIDGFSQGIHISHELICVLEVRSLAPVSIVEDLNFIPK